MQFALELRNVAKQYPGHLALDGVSFDVQPGEFFCLAGPSGCGKTTVLRLVAGFEHPTSGEVLLNGASVGHLPPNERNVSTVFQSYALFPHMTVKQNIEFGLRYKGRRHDAPAALRRVIDLVQLAGKESRLPNQLSGGEKQRVALARSLAIEPDVLLLDEPLSALDPILRKQVRSELKSLQRRVGLAFLFVTHDQEEALSIADRIAVMNRGRIEQVGAPPEIYLKPRTVFVASFIGAMNWVGGVGVRPESLRIGREAPDGCRSVAARVASSSFLGDCVHVAAITAAGESLIAQAPSTGCDFRPGEAVHLWWHPADEVRVV
jgi:ABC-type Fe3+/spermidine/putrescine transport system ATPase subunit